MHMNQVAIAYRTSAERLAIIQSLGLQDAEWVKDRVVSTVKVLGRHGDYTEGTNVAELEFCMAMGGTQFELIRYVEGPNWIAEAARIGVTFPMVAHIGFHLEEGEDWPPIVANGVLAQEAITMEHSNDEVNKAGRRYHYRIYRVGTGAYFKFIKRLTVGMDHHERVVGLEPTTEQSVDAAAEFVAQLGHQGTQDDGTTLQNGEQLGGFMPAQGDEQPLPEATGDQPETAGDTQNPEELSEEQLEALTNPSETAETAETKED